MPERYCLRLPRFKSCWPLKPCRIIHGPDKTPTRDISTNNNPSVVRNTRMSVQNICARIICSAQVEKPPHLCHSDAPSLGPFYSAKTLCSLTTSLYRSFKLFNLIKYSRFVWYRVSQKITVSFTFFASATSNLSAPTFSRCALCPHQRISLVCSLSYSAFQRLSHRQS